MLAHSNVFRRPASKAHMAVFGTAPLKQAGPSRALHQRQDPGPVIVCIVVCRCKLCMQTLQEYETAMQGSEQATLAFHKYMFMYIHVFLGALPYR
jgi:hypothetical protein